MSVVNFLIDVFLHLDTHMAAVIAQYGAWTYGLLFFVIFMETGFVVTPFLPGDSLLFAAAAVAARAGSPLDVWLLFLVTAAAAVLGDTVNYWIGATIGSRLLSNPNSRIFKKSYLDRTHAFFERYGGKAIIIGRFAPFVRTFAPFLAGVGDMRYRRFMEFNVVGGTAWVALFVAAGFLFGRIPAVEKNLTLVLLGVVIVTTIPIVVEVVRSRASGPTPQGPDRATDPEE